MKLETFLSMIFFIAAGPLFAVPPPRGLEIIWTDVEGGAATLIVTPAGETVLIDAGNPGERDAARIEKTLREVVGVDHLDWMIVTHFDVDHYGGVADLAKRIRIDKFADGGFPPEDHPIRKEKLFAGYLAATEGKRTVLKLGEVIPLKASGEGALTPTLRVIGNRQEFVAGEGKENPVCGDPVAEKPVDKSHNADSVVLLLSYGDFQFLDAGDLTWNLERRLVCPENLVGEVDVYQVDHHGLDQSNHPALVRSVKPTVAIANNGPRKGIGPEAFATLKSVPSIKAIYQMHKNLANPPEVNTSDSRIANLAGECSAEIIQLRVESDGESYVIKIPSTELTERWDSTE